MDTKDDILDNFLSAAISTLNAEEIYDSIMDSLTTLFGPDGLLLMMNTQTSRTYHVIRLSGDIVCSKDYCVPSDTFIAKLLDSDGFVPVSADSGELLSLLTARQQAWLKDENIIAFQTLKYHQAVIGFLFIADKSRRACTPEEIRCLERICYYAAYLLRNANLYRNAYYASITDSLTSLYNRKHAFECIENACNERRPISLILLDIDDFKLYNELYGAGEGDNLIYLCAQAIQKEIRDNDMAFRYGADELLILMDGCDQSAAAGLASNIIRRIIRLNTTDTVWNITVTCGISTFPAISDNAQSLLHNAEQAVYYGKLEGKGQLTIYRKGMENRSQNPDIRSAYERVAPTIYALTAAIDAKDNYTFVHSINVSKYAVILAEALGMNDTDIEIIRDAGLLHDIGKISIPENILKKTSHLTPEEYEIMKTHVENSTKMIRYLPDMDYVIPAVLGHHERYDGKGYPRGLAGEDIPYMARILTIADCFDAMTARRPYNQPLPVSHAVGELEKNSGTQFDPYLTKKFVELIYEGKIVV